MTVSRGPSKNRHSTGRNEMLKTPTDDQVRDLLMNSKSIAVIGLSPAASRPSFGVAQYLIRHGYEIYGIRPAAPPEILGRPSFESLDQLDTDVDILDVFRKSEAIPSVVDDIARWMKGRTKKPKALWLQEGIRHEEAEKKAQSLGLLVISNRCILKEHKRLVK